MPSLILKLLKPRPPVAAGTADTQRRWLADNPPAGPVTGWQFPKSTWFQTRLAKVRQARKHG